MQGKEDMKRMFNLSSQLFWVLIGVGLLIIVETLVWIYWRYWGTGSIYDWVSEDEEPDGKYHILHRIKTPVQRIAIVENEGKTLIYGNGDVMFGTTEDDVMYAEALIHVPMAVTKKRERILIIGGGGGITTREALQYPDVKEITTVDADALMMDFGKNLEPLVKFNDGALHHQKVRTVIEDGRAFVENSVDEKWDVIIVDIPEPSKENPTLNRLFSWEFFRVLKERLEPDGVVTISCPSLASIPEYFWSVQATLLAAGYCVLPYHFDIMVEFEDDYGFCLATNNPVSPTDVSILAQTRYLTPERVRDLFHIPYNYSKSWSKYKVQTDHNMVLADIVDAAWGDE